MTKLSNSDYINNYNSFKNQIDTEKFFNYYSWHSATETAKVFHCSTNDVKRLCQEYNYVKNKEYERYQKLIYKFNIDINELISLYKIQPLAVVCTKYNMCSTSVKFLLDYNHIKIRTKGEECKLTKQLKYNNPNYNNIQQGVITREQSYESREAYNKHFTEIYKQHKIDEYGSWEAYINQHSAKVSDTAKNRTTEEHSQVGQHISEALKNKSTADWQKIVEQRNQTLVEKYGSYTNFIDHRNTITSTTNLEKYNVPWACMRTEARVHGNDSAINKTFSWLLKNKFDDYDEARDREFPLESFSYDFKYHDYLIEIDPVATHNSTFGIYNTQPKSFDYHQNKSLCAKKYNYTCLHIFDWDNVDLILDIIDNTKTRLYARNCTIKLVDDIKIINLFLQQYHLQDTCRNQSVCLGLYYNNELMQIMTFGKPRYNKNYEYELLRLCTKTNYLVIGGAEKLFKYFIKNYSPKSIISYCDNAKFNGDIYNKLGFTLETYGKPSKHWYNIKTKQHITDNLLRQRGYDQLFKTDYGKGTSNEQLMLNAGFVEIYDCGQSVYVYQYCYNG